MSHKQSKRIRRLLKNKQISFVAAPYKEFGRLVVSDKGRRFYQYLKTKVEA